jgi:hypothetical protein
MTTATVATVATVTLCTVTLAAIQLCVAVRVLEHTGHLTQALRHRCRFKPRRGVDLAAPMFCVYPTKSYPLNSKRVDITKRSDSVS